MRVSCLLWTEIAFGGWRTRFSILDLDITASWRASQTEDEVAQCEEFAGRLRQANTAMNCARLCGEVRQGVREAKVRSQFFLIDDETLRRYERRRREWRRVRIDCRRRLGPRIARRF